ncbi:hypothetical protein MHU86_2784 [Fragilaria crotonensis]|nr:hypothetical protein MHU86_2784 [Fragilaria crotonensis]
MENALELCGFNAQTIRYLISQGFNSPDDLLLATESELNSMATSVARNPPRNMAQINMPFMALKNLKGLRFWADERKRTGLDADADDFTGEDVAIFTAKCQEYNELKDAAKDEDASKPDALKKLTGWALWNESFQNYLRQIVGAAKIPLIYLARNERDNPDEPLIPANFGTPTEYLIEATIFRGRHYDIDNPPILSRVKVDFINTHQTAHNEILDCDPSEAVPESKKVADFLKGITDPKLESAVSVVLGDVKLLNDFQLCQQYLSTTVENRATLEKSKERNISGLKSGGEKSDQKGKGGKLPKNFKLENKWYPRRSIASHPRAARSAQNME